jgi:16S rRNA (guanine527-N7)-methyltransferase
VTDPERQAYLLQLCAQTGLTAAEPVVARVLEYLDRMLRLNQIHNLTGIRDMDHAVVLHALDCLQALPLLELAPPGSMLDLGTGNGFPGVVAAVAFPDREVLLVERRSKKAQAVAELMGQVGLENAVTVTCDGQHLVQERPSCEGTVAAVLARAVGPLADVLKLARPWLTRGGIVIQWKEAPLDTEEAFQADRRGRKLGLLRLPDRVYQLPALPPKQSNPPVDERSLAPRQRTLVTFQLTP